VIFVLDPMGNIVDSHQMDGVVPIGNETALLKAKTALYARSSTAAVAQRFNNVEGRVIRLDLGKQEGLAYYFVSGGLPIVVEDQLIGAVGVGGGNADEQCAYQAMQKVLGPQPPLATAAPPAGGAAPAEGRGRGGR
jgi:glc operon protein GlcG